MKKLGELKLSEIKHWGVYDPVQRHLEYLQNRQLKGRRPGQAKPVAAKKPVSVKAAPANKMHSVKLPNGKTLNVNSAQLHVALGHVQQRIQKLQANLANLQKQLAAEKAKASKPKKVETKAQKAQKAKAYRQTHKQQLKNKAKAAKATKGTQTKTKGSTTPKTKSTTTSVASLEKQITKVQNAIKTATEIRAALASAGKSG